ncbi:MAG: serine/threonine-protein kinase [Nocardioidaceae bacterium]
MTLNRSRVGDEGRVEPQPAPVVPGYQLVDHLARGQFLDVHSVWSLERDCLCVAKLLRPDVPDDGAAAERLRSEGALLLSLSHPGLVRCYEVATCSPGDRPAAILETLPGETLGHLMSRRQRGLAAEDVVQLGRQLVSVLSYLHRQGCLHLDLKASNVIVSDGSARLLDLSHARPPGACPAGFGTREYMSPEQVAGGAVTEASDVFGLGGVLYRAATTRRPFGADRGGSGPPLQPTPARLRRRTLPAPLLELVAACLDPAPSARPSTSETRKVLTKLDGSAVQT